MKFDKFIPVSVILSLLVILSSCATPQRFQGAGEEKWMQLQDQSDGVKIFVDEISMKHIPDTLVRIRVRYRYASPKPFDSGYIEELVVDNEYDCNNKKVYKIHRSEAHFIGGRSVTDTSERIGHILPDDVVFLYLCR